MCIGELAPLHGPQPRYSSAKAALEKAEQRSTAGRDLHSHLVPSNLERAFNDLGQQAGLELL